MVIQSFLVSQQFQVVIQKSLSILDTLFVTTQKFFQGPWVTRVVNPHGDPAWDPMSKISSCEACEACEESLELIRAVMGRLFQKMTSKNGRYG